MKKGNKNLNSPKRIIRTGKKENKIERILKLPWLNQTKKEKEKKIQNE